MLRSLKEPASSAAKRKAPFVFVNPLPIYLLFRLKVKSKSQTTQKPKGKSDIATARDGALNKPARFSIFL